MEQTKTLSVLIIDQQLNQLGILANAAFVLGLTAGRELPKETFGHDVTDGGGNTHRYLTNIGHYVRKAGQSKIRTLRSALTNNPQVSLVDYCEDAAPADYQQYSDNIKNHSGEQITYRALHIYGPEEIVLPLTKNLSRL